MKTFPLKATSPSAVQCKICSAIFLERESLMEHLQLHVFSKKVKQTTLKCPFCPREVADDDLETLRQHIQEYHMETPQWSCPLCDAKLSRKTQLFLHLRAHQMGVVAPLSCSQCDRQFWSSTKLKLHEKLHADEHAEALSKGVSKNLYIGHSSDSVTCRMCMKTFESEDKLLLHAVQHHAKVSHYSCRSCCCSFETFTEWNFHMQLATCNHELDNKLVTRKSKRQRRSSTS